MLKREFYGHNNVLDEDMYRTYSDEGNRHNLWWSNRHRKSSLYLWRNRHTNWARRRGRRNWRIILIPLYKNKKMMYN